MDGKQKILVIEDDQYLRDVYQEVLTEAGYDITASVDGEEGLVKIREGGYSLILLDMMMPRLDGLGVLEALKGNSPKVTNGPIILLTNLAHDPVINKALSLGAKDYLIKSDLNPDQLVVKIRELIEAA
jgi:CheY-like chemotaxis protein